MGPIREPLPRTDPKPLPKPEVRPLPPRTDPKPLPKPAVRPLPPKPIRKPLPKPEEKVIIEEPELIIEPKPELIIEPKPEASPCQIFHRMARHPRRSFMVHAFASSSTNNQQQQQKVIKSPVTATQKELIAVKPQQNCFIVHPVAKVPRNHFTTSSASAAASAFVNHPWMTAGNDKKPTYFTHTETSTSQNTGKASDHHYNVKTSASASSSSSKRSSVRAC